MASKRTSTITTFFSTKKRKPDDSLSNNPSEVQPGSLTESEDSQSLRLISLL